MKKLFHNILWILSVQIFIIACQEEDPKLGSAPTSEDAVFTFSPTAANDNIISFSSTSQGFLKVWDFGNGSKGKGDEVTGIFPLKGTYTVTLTVYTSGGSISSSQTVDIAETDPTLLDIPVYNMLTGGNEKPEGKTWIIDATRAGHFGVGPNPSDPVLGDVPNYYAAGVNEKAGAGLYNDEFTFILSGFEYNYETNGDVFLNNKYGTEFPGSYSNAGDLTAPFTAPDNLTWTVAEEDGVQYLTISTGGFIGYYTGVTTYKIVKLTENEMILRAEDAADPGLAWYQRLIPKDYTPPGPATSTLPIDFEGVKPPFNGFEGSTYDVVDNPDASGINTSAKVGKYVKGTNASWAGIETTLSSKLDFSANTIFKYKVYSPVTGKALLKLEAADGSAAAIEVFADVTKVNEWETLSFDFSAATSGVYNKMALFLDFENNNGGTFYFDDIAQAAEVSGLTEEALTGGSAKSWVLKPAAGSFGVGPAKGSDAWWPNGADVSGDRPCLFNDEFIFKTGGVYEYDANGDLYGEAYMGLPNGCADEADLPTDAQAWGSGVHTFTFIPATESAPAYIKVTGTGAFIGLQKAYNGGEYAAAPPTTDGTVTYEVLSYVKTATAETLTITVDISGDGTGFWSFVLIAQ